MQMVFVCVMIIFALLLDVVSIAILAFCFGLYHYHSHYLPFISPTLEIFLPHTKLFFPSFPVSPIPIILTALRLFNNSKFNLSLFRSSENHNLCLCSHRIKRRVKVCFTKWERLFEIRFRCSNIPLSLKLTSKLKLYFTRIWISGWLKVQ